MTREQLQKELATILNRGNFDTKLNTPDYILAENICDYLLEDKMYEALNHECIRLRQELQEFESRTCESCNYYKEINRTCGNCTNIRADSTQKVYSNFYCNKWEKK